MIGRRAMVIAVAMMVSGLSAVRADVKPYPLFTDNMVLQRNAKVNFWGTAAPEESVTITVSGPAGNSEVAVKADKDGKWKGSISGLKAGTGYTVTFKAGNTVTLNNVAVGEVWVCSGQSNMEWSINASETPDKIKAASKDPGLRLFTVQKRTAPEPITDPNDLKHFTKWVEAGPDTVGGFSAVGYFFGSYLRKNLPDNVPVGLIHTSWGGTPAEAWTSMEALEAVPELKHYADSGKKTMKSVIEGRKNFDPAKAQAAYKEALEKHKAALEKHKEAVEKAKADGKPAPKAPTPPPPPAPPGIGPNVPSSLYNAMIAPLLPFTVQGAIWYQGESNAGRAYEYRSLFQTMIKDWRAKWNSDLPFMLVQLAPFMAKSADPQESAWAELREAQYLATVKLPKVGMAVITDVGDEKDIHPRPKQPVGERLAIAALAITYGQKNEPIGPTYKELKVEGDKAIVTFDHLGGGLVGKGEKLTGFTIAGEDKKFYNAEAEIKGDTVVVSSPNVSKPVAVRYGWANFPVVNLWSKSGLPAVPFRTDSFPGVTQPKK